MAALQDLGVLFSSTELLIFNSQGPSKNDLTLKRVGPEGLRESKESEMTRSEVRDIVFLFVCSVSSLKCSIFGLHKLLNFWNGFV